MFSFGCCDPFWSHSPLGRIGWRVLDILVGPNLRRSLGCMGRAGIVAYVAAMVIVIVGADVLFFRGYFWPRLMANIGIVLVFGAFYLRFVRV
jgi:hypothetical protein